MRIAAFTRHLFSVRSTDVPSPKLVQKRADGRPAIENRMRNGSSSASLDSKPKEEYQLGFLRNKALVSFGGNVTALERLLEHERQRRPGCGEMDILTAVVDQLERDRR